MAISTISESEGSVTLFLLSSYCMSPGSKRPEKEPGGCECLREQRFLTHNLGVKGGEGAEAALGVSCSLTCARCSGRAASVHLLSLALVAGEGWGGTVSISQRRRLRLRCSVAHYFQLLMGDWDSTP